MPIVTYKLHMPKTGFDKFFATQMRKPSFAKKYASARAQVDAVDRIVRRLFTAKAPNPTLSTILKVAAALGYKMQLVPAKPSRKHAA